MVIKNKIKKSDDAGDSPVRVSNELSVSYKDFTTVGLEYILGSSINGWRKVDRSTVIDPTSKKLELDMQRKERELELATRKEEAIVKLIEEAEEVEIEELSDDKNIFNIGGGLSESSISLNFGKDKSVSYYRKYKFKRGGKIKEHTETNIDDESENT